METRRNHGFNRVDWKKIDRQLTQILNFYRIQNANVFSRLCRLINWNVGQQPPGQQPTRTTMIDSGANMLDAQRRTIVFVFSTN